MRNTTKHVLALVPCLSAEVQLEVEAFILQRYLEHLGRGVVADYTITSGFETNKIGAIKLIREHTRFGLDEAKNAFERCRIEGITAAQAAAINQGGLSLVKR